MADQNTTSSGGQLVNLPLPMSYVTELVAEQKGILQNIQTQTLRFAWIDGLLTACNQFGGTQVGLPLSSIGLVGTIGAAMPITSSGTPMGPQNNNQQGARAEKNATQIFHEALNAFGDQGATISDISAWAKTNYPQFTYRGNHLSGAGVREWDNRRAQAVGPVGAKQNPRYYAVGLNIENAHMAQEKKAPTRRPRQRQTAE